MGQVATTVAILLAAAGIVAGYLIAWWFARSGKRDLRERNLALDTQIAGLNTQVSALRSLLAGVAEATAKQANSQGEDRGASGLAGAISSTADVPTSAVDLLVRSKLGALVDERGEVAVKTFLEQVLQALPTASLASVESSLQRLRTAGAVSWIGDDVKQASAVTVLPK